MTTLTSQKEELIIKEVVVKQPSLLLTMPFEPKLYSSSVLQQNVRRVQQKAETMLLAEYSRTDVKPLVERLQSILRTLNYGSYKKSLVIFLSASTEKILYPDISLEENIVLNNDFHVSNLLQLIQQPVKYLVCVLSDYWAKTYLGNGSEIKLLKRDAPAPETTGNAPLAFPAAEDLRPNTGSFYHNIVTDFNIMLKAYPLPVIVIGSVSKVNYFCDLAENTKDIVQLIHKDTATMNERQIISTLQPYIRNWNQVRLHYVNRQLRNALLNNMVISGIDNVLNLLRCKGKLVIENRYLHAGMNLDKHIINSNGDLVMDNYEIKLSLLLEQLLQNGSSVELVPDGFLKDYKGVAFISNRPHRNLNYKVTQPENSFEFF